MYKNCGNNLYSLKFIFQKKRETELGSVEVNFLIYDIQKCCFWQVTKSDHQNNGHNETVVTLC